VVAKSFERIHRSNLVGMGVLPLQLDQIRAVKVGVATWVGIMVGLIAKVVLAFIMVGIFGAALLI
jgi:aconitase A